MRIRDWSSDVFASDLPVQLAHHHRNIRLEEARADDEEGERRPEDVDRGIILTADALDRHQTVPDGEQQAAEQHRLALAEIAVGELAAEDRRGIDAAGVGAVNEVRIAFREQAMLHRKSVVSGKRGAARVDSRGRRSIKKKT